jgi:hypothetical protein
MTDKQKIFKSNASKLMFFTDRLEEFKRTGIMRPISINIALTNACNNKCGFCGYKNRDPAEHLTFDQACSITKLYADRDALAVEIIGGGDPSMSPYLPEYVEYCSTLGLKVGMITNGRRVLEGAFSQEMLSKLTWLRVSCNWLVERWYKDAYPDYPTFQIPSNVTFSFAYIWWKESTREHAYRIERLMAANPHAAGMKIQPDVMTATRFDIPDFIDPRIWVNKKEEAKRSARCYMGLIKPQIEANGNIYRCSCGCLAEDEFIPDHRKIGTIDAPPAMTPDGFDTTQCTLCFYSFYNDIFQLLERGLPHVEFV